MKKGSKQTEKAKQKIKSAWTPEKIQRLKDSWTPERRKKHSEFRSVWRKHLLTRKVRDAGGCLIISLPRQLAAALGIADGDTVEIEPTEDGFLIHKVKE